MTNGQIDSLLSMNGQLETFLAWTSQMVFIVRIVAVVIGLIVCFLGLKLIRVLSAIAGLAVGAGIGTAVVFGFQFSGTMIPVTILVCAVMVAVFAAAVRKLGVFLVVFLYTAGIVMSLRIPQIIILLAVCGGAALLMSVLSLIWTDPIVVIITGISGALSAGISAAALLFAGGNIWLGYGVGAVLALIGIWTQFMVQSRKIGKKEKVYARQMRDQVSRESEVEKARRILEEEEDDDESGSRKIRGVKKSKKSKTTQKTSARDTGSDDMEEEDDDITIINEEL
ncbi:MAG: hypothetical protein HFG85_13410 [Dorea sp.]|nr:hypothetical protein [Dorea sp.]